MPSAKLRHENESFDSLIRRWKRAVEKADTLKELRKREFFEKPSSIRKRAKAAAQKRHQRIRELEKMTQEERARYHAKREKKKQRYKSEQQQKSED